MDVSQTFLFLLQPHHDLEMKFTIGSQGKKSVLPIAFSF